MDRFRSMDLRSILLLAMPHLPKSHPTKVLRVLRWVLRLLRQRVRWLALLVLPRRPVALAQLVQRALHLEEKNQMASLLRTRLSSSLT